MKKLINTKILEKHGKIGPFFYKEFLFIVLGAAMLFNIAILLNLIIDFHKSYAFIGPVLFAVIAAVWRFFNKDTSNPWHIYELMSYYFFQPKHLDAFKSRINNIFRKKVV